MEWSSLNLQINTTIRTLLKDIHWNSKSLSLHVKQFQSYWISNIIEPFVIVGVPSSRVLGTATIPPIHSLAQSRTGHVGMVFSANKWMDTRIGGWIDGLMNVWVDWLVGGWNDIYYCLIPFTKWPLWAIRPDIDSRKRSCDFSATPLTSRLWSLARLLCNYTEAAEAWNWSLRSIYGQGWVDLSRPLWSSG
jgi:hypothetical protein